MTRSNTTSTRHQLGGTRRLAAALAMAGALALLGTPAATAATALPASTPPTPDLPEPEEGVGTIQVASLPIPHNVQFIELPRFAEAYGLDVEWVSFQRYADTQLAVSRGDVAFAAAGYHTIALDTAPTDVRIVAGGNSGAQALVIRSGIEVEDWADLAGLNIGVAPNSGPDVQFTLAAREAGFDPTSIERVNFTTIGPPTLIALRSGEIDGMLCWEIACAQAVVAGDGYYAPIDIGQNPTGHANTLVLVNAEWAAEHPNATTLLVRAYIDAVEHFRNDPAAWVEAITTVTGSEAEEIEMALGTINLEWELYRERALATAAAYAEFGISTQDMSDAVDSYLVYDFLEAATGLPPEDLGA